MNQERIISIEQISSKIHEFRGMKVMLDKDLAEFYGVPVKRLNEQVRRNRFRFPNTFYFQLNNQEQSVLRSQNATANISSKSRINSCVFTRDGAVMASYVLKSEYAVAKSIYVVKAFNAISDIIPVIKDLLGRVEALEKTVFINKDINEKFRFAMNKIITNTARQGDFVVLLEDMEHFKKEFEEIRALINKLNSNG